MLRRLLSLPLASLLAFALLVFATSFFSLLSLALGLIASLLCLVRLACDDSVNAVSEVLQHVILLRFLLLRVFV